MKSIVLLNSSENTAKVEEEEQVKFVRSLLETMGLPLDNTWNEHGLLSTEGKIKLRNVLGTYNIQIIDDSDGGLKLFCDGEQIAEWKKCYYVLKQDINQLDPRKKLYLEMHIDYSSVFDQSAEDVNATHD